MNAISFPKIPKDYKPSAKVMAMTLGSLPEGVDLEKELKGYGELVVRDQRVTPCCSPSYTHISFNVTITN